MRNGDHAASPWQVAAEFDPVEIAQRAHVGGHEVRAARQHRLQTDRRQAVRESVTFALQFHPGRRDPAVPFVQRPGDGRLERRTRHVGEELLDGGDLGDQLRRAQRPADLPAGRGERLAGRGDPHGALPHAGKSGQRDVFGIVEGEVLVDLVADHQDVVLRRPAGRSRPDRPGSSTTPVGLCGELINNAFVRGVNAAASSSMIKSEVGTEQPDADPGAAGQIDRCRVRVVERFERDHLVAGIDERQDRGRQRLGRAGGDQHLGVRVVVQAVVALRVIADRLPQRLDAASRRVLVDAGGDR